MPIVLTKTSRAAKAPTRPTPIFQSKPRGLMAGSIPWPRRPAREYSDWAAAIAFSIATSSGTRSSPLTRLDDFALLEVVEAAFHAASFARNCVRWAETLDVMAAARPSGILG